MKLERNSRVLVVSWNEMLRQTRRLILGTYFETEAAGKMSEVGHLLLEKNYDAIVLCDTLSDSECLAIAERAEVRNGAAEIILLEAPLQERPAAFRGSRVQCMDGPLALLNECARVFGISIGVRCHPAVNHAVKPRTAIAS